MSVDVKVHFEFDIKNVAHKIGQKMEQVNERSARLGAVSASAMFMSKYRALEPDRHVEHIASSFKAMPSIKRKKNNLGWIFGPMASPKEDWAESVGGRSFFFEYGRMPPGRGRGSVGRSSYVNVDTEGQPPRPFMRPTKAMLRPRHQATMERELKRSVNQLNQKYKK